MPHIVVEYSPNLERAIDPARIVAALHEAALATGVFPPGGVRTRAYRADHVRVADGDPANAFVHVTVRIGQGRDTATRKRAAGMVFDALSATLAPLDGKVALALSVEMVEIAAETSFKKNALHERMKAKT